VRDRFETFGDCAQRVCSSTASGPIHIIDIANVEVVLDYDGLDARNDLSVSFDGSKYFFVVAGDS
jgi:hypothetical protein